MDGSHWKYPNGAADMGPSIKDTGEVGLCPDVRLIILGHRIGCLDIYSGDMGGNYPHL